MEVKSSVTFQNQSKTVYDTGASNDVGVHYLENEELWMWVQFSLREKWYHITVLIRFSIQGLLRDQGTWKEPE